MHQQIQKIDNEDIIQKLQSFWKSTKSATRSLQAQRQSVSQIHDNKPYKSPNNKLIQKPLKPHQKSLQYYDNEQSNRRKYQISRKIAYKQQFPLITYGLGCMVILFIIAFIIDFYFELENQKLIKQTEINKCFEDYHENNCLQPLQALIEECGRLQLCYSRNLNNSIKYSHVFVKTLSSLIQIATNHVPLVGFILLLTVFGVYLFRPTIYHEEKISKFQ